jgi:hypothetical protein
MLKVCQKENCREPAIKRGKYCVTHRTNKTNIPKKNQNIPVNEKKNIFKNNYDEDIELALKISLEELSLKKYNDKKLEDDRNLKLEQEEEYNNIMRMDLERIRKEKERIEDIETKRVNVIKNEPLDDVKYFNIKFKLSNKDVLKKFKLNSTVKDIRDFLDVYFEDNKINIINYNLVVNQTPIRKITIDENHMVISSLNLTNNFILFLENLDD